MPTNITTLSSNEKPWGSFYPMGKNKLLFRLIKLGLGHGNIKKVIQGNWDTEHSPFVDINYHGIKMRCFIGTNNIEGKILFSSNLREKEELALLKPYLINGGTFIDIGANIGYYSLMAAKMGASKVVAFEPNKIVRDRFEFNRDTNEYQLVIDIIPVALGSKSQDTTMTVPLDDLGASTLLDSSVDGETIPTRVERIDNVLYDNGIKEIAALKIDVEGYEYEALAPLLNCPDTLLPKLIIIEHAHAKLWKDNIINLLLHRGYSKIGKNRSNTFLSLCVGS